MEDLWKPDYIDLDSGAWLASKTRRKLKDLRLWGLYWEIIHQLNEAGGTIELDKQDLLELTQATPEELDRVLGIEHFVIEHGWLSHRVVTEKIRRIRERLGKSAEGGKRSGEVRRAKAEARRQPDTGTHFEPPSEPVPKGGGSKGLKDLRTEGLTEGLTRAREASPGSQPEVASNPPGQVKTGSHREPERPRADLAPEPRRGPRPPGPPAPEGARAVPVRTLGPDRIEQLVETCLSARHDDRDIQRPWLNKAFGAMFNRLRLPEQLELEAAFTERYGYGIDTGPQAPRPGGISTNGAAPAALAAAGNGSGALVGIPGAGAGEKSSRA